jgi:hypothetical protein
MPDPYNPDDYSCPEWVLVARAAAWVDDGVAPGIPSLYGQNFNMAAFHKHGEFWSTQSKANMVVLRTII